MLVGTKTQREGLPPALRAELERKADEIDQTFRMYNQMPDLRWQWGYPFALLLMIISAVVPYLIFKYKRWL